VFGRKTETIHKNKNILNSLAAVIHKNKCNAAGNSEKVVHPCSGLMKFLSGKTVTASLLNVFVYVYVGWYN